MFMFVHFLHVELDQAHFLADSCQGQVMERLDQFSVHLSSLQATHEHFIGEHWVPMQ